MKPAEMEKLAQSNLDLQRETCDKIANNYSMMHYLIKDAVKSAFNIMVEKTSIDRSATKETPVYATITLNKEQYERSMSILQEIERGNFRGLSESMLYYEQESELKQNEELLEKLRK